MKIVKKCVEWLQGKVGEPMEISLIKGSNEIGLVRQLEEDSIKEYTSKHLNKNLLSRNIGRELPKPTDFWYSWATLTTCGKDVNKKYYTDGCYAVAHDIYREFYNLAGDDEEWNVCGKLAIIGDFNIDAGSCHVYWRYHIVPWWILRDMGDINVVHDRLLFEVDNELYEDYDWMELVCNYGPTGTGRITEVCYLPGRYFALDYNYNWVFDDSFSITDRILEKYKDKRGCDPID